MKTEARRLEERAASDFVARRRRADHRTITHSILNLERTEMHKLDHFYKSVRQHTDADSYSALLSNQPVGVRGERKFQRLPFQNFMMIDSVSAMINADKLTQHRTQIFMMIKEWLGLGSYTEGKIKALQHRLNVRVVGHNIRRREGKTVGLYANLALMMANYPTALFNGLYTVHTLPATKAAFKSVQRMIPPLCDNFNRIQEDEYNHRARMRGGPDPDDCYYRALLRTVQTNEFVITITFYKHSSSGSSGQLAGENVLSFRTCAKEDVSIYHVPPFMYRRSSRVCRRRTLSISSALKSILPGMWTHLDPPRSG